MKHIMNDVQTVKSIDAYQNMTNVQKERFGKRKRFVDRIHFRSMVVADSVLFRTVEIAF